MTGVLAWRCGLKGLIGAFLAPTAPAALLGAALDAGHLLVERGKAKDAGSESQLR